jgi:hypothetical protein
MANLRRDVERKGSGVTEKRKTIRFLSIGLREAFEGQ